VYTYSDTDFKHVPNYEKTYFFYQSKTVQLFDTADNFVRCVEICTRAIFDGADDEVCYTAPVPFLWCGISPYPLADGTSLNIIPILHLVLPFLNLLQHHQLGVPHIFLNVLIRSTRTH
jgi:hypothetical protein